MPCNWPPGGELKIIIITGGRDDSILTRFNRLGITDIVLNSTSKLEKLLEYRDGYGIPLEDMLYMGDDVPDIDPMKAVGLPCCPADACQDVLSVAKYVSPPAGRSGLRAGCGGTGAQGPREMVRGGFRGVQRITPHANLRKRQRNGYPRNRKQFLTEALKGRTLVLASTSPRRIEFFEKLGVPFLARTGDVREHYPDTLTDGREIVQYLSRLKARAAGPLAPQEIIVGADTLVWADGRPLGKPRDEQEAEATLRALSGRHA